MFTFIPFEFPVSRDGKYTKVCTNNVILKTRRDQLGLSQQDVADMVGISLGHYQRLEYEEPNLEGCSMRVGLAVCATLLLDPFEMISVNATQPDPESIKPLEPFDTHLLVDLRKTKKSKKVGRKQIRREIMTIYVNHSYYNLIIPNDVLTALGKPKYIEFLQLIKEKRILIRGLSSPSENSFTVPNYTYEGHLLAMPGGHEITNDAKIAFGWGNALQAVECFLVKDSDDNILVLADLHTAKPTAPLHEELILPTEFDDEDEGDFEEDGDEELDEDY